MSSSQVLLNIDPKRMCACLTSGALGDALGLPHEFKHSSVGNYTGYLQYQAVQKGSHGNANRYLAVSQISDDTEMTLALARCLISNNGYVERSVIQSYLDWANSCNGFIGTNTKDLFQGIKTIDGRGYSARYQKKFVNQQVKENTQSNGCLMRCSPLACLPDFRSVYTDVSLSNPSRVCGDAVMVQVVALRAALVGTSASKIWEFIKQVPETKEVQSLMTDVELAGDPYLVPNTEGAAARARWPLTKTGTAGKGWVLYALYCSMYVLRWFLTRPNPTFFDIYAWVITRPGDTDTDTNASIAGSLAGAVLGWDALVANQQQNLGILFGAMNQPNLQYPRPPQYTIVDVQQVAYSLAALTKGVDKLPVSLPEQKIVPLSNEDIRLSIQNSATEYQRKQQAINSYLNPAISEQTLYNDFNNLNSTLLNKVKMESYFNQTEGYINLDKLKVLYNKAKETTDEGKLVGTSSLDDILYELNDEYKEIKIIDNKIYFLFPDLENHLQQIPETFEDEEDDPHRIVDPDDSYENKVYITISSALRTNRRKRYDTLTEKEMEELENNEIVYNSAMDFYFGYNTSFPDECNSVKFLDFKALYIASYNMKLVSLSFDELLAKVWGDKKEEYLTYINAHL